MRSPQFHQQSIEVHQFLAIHFLNRVEVVNSDPNPLKVFEFGGLKRFGDPLDVLGFRPKIHMFEFCDFGEVERRWLPKSA